MITVYTATFNRAYVLEKLYNSLLRQTDQYFDWLIIDDGSQDDTYQLVL
jgi:glycosyltransferase involved in cell wall biosynthesis